LEGVLGRNAYAVANFEILLGLDTDNRLYPSTNHNVTDAQLFDGNFTMGR
jgi:hypothetical protein